MSAELPVDLQKAAEEVDYDPDRKKRQGDGWFKLYIECPDCEVPMARTTVISESVSMPPARDANRSEHRMVCPECRTIAGIMKVEKVIGEYEDLGDAFEDDE